MGKIVSNRGIPASELLRLPSPVLLCVNRTDYEEALKASDYLFLSLNFPLARLLTGLDEPDLPNALMRGLASIIPRSGKMYLNDYEMLFDPRYGIDPLRLFVEDSRRVKLIVRWCGRVEGNELLYAEPGYVDYRRYKISDYNITVVN